MKRPGRIEADAWSRRVGAILDAFRRFVGHDLVPRSGDMAEDARRLFELPQPVLAHDASPRPLLHWVNRAAALAFDSTPEALLGRPSAATAPAASSAPAAPQGPRFPKPAPPT